MAGKERTKTEGYQPEDYLTDRAMQAGVAAYATHLGGKPAEAVVAIWKAVHDEVQREALELYWNMYD